jgi:hypothetical protein
MYPNPLWSCVTYAYSRARRRVVGALGGNPESGALTLEWIVIAGILVAAAVAASLVFGKDIGTWEANLTKGS